MTSEIELEIQKLLKTINDPALVADELLKKWHRNELTTEDSDRVAHFLLTFGFYNALIENIARKVKENSLLPWGAIARILVSNIEEPPKEVLDSILIGASEQEGLDVLARDPDLDKVDMRFEKIRREMVEERTVGLAKLRADYLDQAEIYRNDRLFGKEADILNRLLAYFPNDQVVKNYFSELNANQASERISRRGTRIDEEEFLYRKEQEIPSELKKVAADIAKKLLKKVNQNPDMAYNIALGLYQMGHIEAAIETLEKAEPNESKDWFKIELYLESHRYLDVLSELDALEKKYAADPEIIFSSLYLRARALWGLHQHTSAVEILESLIRVRPDYRSAQSLLTQWREVLL